MYVYNYYNAAPPHLSVCSVRLYVSSNSKNYESWEATEVQLQRFLRYIQWQTIRG